MSLSNYPDEQVCTIKFESFSYSTAQLQLQWRERSASQVLFDSRGFGMIVQGWPMSFETRLHLPCRKIKVQFFIVQVNPGITLDQFALSVDLEDNYKTDSYDLEYPGLIMTIRSYLADRGLIKQKKVIHIDASFQVNKRCWISPPSDLSATVWKCVLIISFFSQT